MNSAIRRSLIFPPVSLRDRMRIALRRNEQMSEGSSEESIREIVVNTPKIGQPMLDRPLLSDRTASRTATASSPLTCNCLAAGTTPFSIVSLRLRSFTKRRLALATLSRRQWKRMGPTSSSASSYHCKPLRLTIYESARTSWRGWDGQADGAVRRARWLRPRRPRYGSGSVAAMS
jgi:hypothetical protein